MLIHAVFDNKTEIPKDLTYKIYNGYFNGTNAVPNINWFNTATLLSSGKTSDLSSLAAATNNEFDDAGDRSLSINGYFRAKKTGIYTFYTSSDEPSFLYINNIPIVLNEATPSIESRFGIYHMVAGTYYKFDVYYGEDIGTQTFSAGYYEPDDTEVPQRALTGNATSLYNVNYPGEYNVTISSQGPSTREKWFAFDKIMYGANRMESVGSMYTRTIGSFGAYYNGNKTTSVVDGGTYSGEWLQLELPDAIRIKHFKMSRRTDSTNALIDLFTFLGSNDPSTGWYKLYERTTPSNSYWSSNIYEVKSFDVNQNENEYKYYRIAVFRTVSGSAFTIGELILYTETPTTDTTKFITNAAGLDVFYNQDWVPGSGPLSSVLTYVNPSLYGRFKVNLIGLYVDRSAFTTDKDNLLYISSPQLYQEGNGSLFLVLHEEPVSGDTARKDYHLFSDEFQLECKFEGIIEMTFTRTNNIAQFQRALLVMDAIKI